MVYEILTTVSTLACLFVAATPRSDRSLRAHSEELMAEDRSNRLILVAQWQIYEARNCVVLIPKVMDSCWIHSVVHWHVNALYIWTPVVPKTIFNLLEAESFT